MIETNANGGKQSRLESGFHLGFPTKGVLEVSKVVREGADRYEVNNWRLISPEEHYNHAMEHLMRLGDPNDPGTEDHAAHAACRMLMYLETRRPGYVLAWQIVPPSIGGIGGLAQSLAQSAGLNQQSAACSANVINMPNRMIC